MNNKKSSLENFEEFNHFEIKLHEHIICPLFEKPIFDPLKIPYFKLIFQNGPESLRNDSEVSINNYLENKQTSPTNISGLQTPSVSENSPKTETKTVLTDFIENSLMYQVFRKDFTAILEFCLNPEKYSTNPIDPKLHPLSRLLLIMIRKYRVNKLKTEQKIKKILNHAYDMMKRQYLSTQYKSLGHISDAHKKEVFVHYFNFQQDPSDIFIKRMVFQPIWRSAEKFNLAYNKRFFQYVSNCPVFLSDLNLMIDHLEILAVETIKNDLRLFIKDVVRFSYQNASKPIHSYLPDQKMVMQFFDSQVQKELNKKGIKFPWTEQQYKRSLEILRAYLKSGELAS